MTQNTNQISAVVVPTSDLYRYVDSDADLNQAYQVAKIVESEAAQQMYGELTLSNDDLVCLDRDGAVTTPDDGYEALCRDARVRTGTGESVAQDVLAAAGEPPSAREAKVKDILEKWPATKIASELKPSDFSRMTPDQRGLVFAKVLLATRGGSPDLDLQACFAKKVIGPALDVLVRCRDLGVELKAPARQYARELASYLKQLPEKVAGAQVTGGRLVLIDWAYGGAKAASTMVHYLSGSALSAADSIEALERIVKDSRIGDRMNGYLRGWAIGKALGLLEQARQSEAKLKSLQHPATATALLIESPGLAHQTALARSLVGRLTKIEAFSDQAVAQGQQPSQELVDAATLLDNTLGNLHRDDYQRLRYLLAGSSVGKHLLDNLSLYCTSTGVHGTNLEQLVHPQ